MAEFMFTVTDVGERMFLEQALGWYREMNRVAQESPDGQVLALTEAVARDGGRELIRRSFETVLNMQASQVEKKGRASGPVRAAKTVDATADVAGEST